MRFGTTLNIIATLVMLSLLFISCGEKENKKDEYKDLIAIDITNNGNLSVLKEKEKVRFFAEGIFKDGSTKVLDVTKLKWNTSDSSIAYISDDGLFTAIRQGVTIITASYKEIESNEVNMRIVSEAGLQSIETKIASSSSKFFVGEVYQFKAIGKYGTGDTQDMTESVTWKSSDENIATISNSFGSHGRVTIKSVGTVEIYCFLNGINGTHIPITTEEIKVDDIILTIDKNDVYVDERVKASAVAKLSNGDEKNIINDVEWHYETTLIPNKTNDNFLSGAEVGVYKFHISYKGENSNTIELNVKERVGVLQTLELKLSPIDDIYQNETLVNIDIIAHYSDHDEDVTFDSYLVITPNEVPAPYVIENSSIKFLKSGDFILHAEYKPDGAENWTISENVNIHVNELASGVIPDVGDLVINEMLVAPPTDSSLGDANNDGIRSGTDDEFIEIVNVSDKILDLSKVYLSDMADNIIASFPDDTLMRPHQVIVIFGGGNPTGDFGGATVFTLVDSSLSLNNSGDIIFINLNEDNDDNIANDKTIFSAIYDEWNWRYGSAVLYPELESTNAEGSYKHHCNPEGLDPAPNCDNYFSPGTKMDGSPFFQ